MAESLEDIIIIEEDDAAGFDDASSEEIVLKYTDESKKKKLLIFGGAALALILIITIVLLIIFKSSNIAQDSSMEFIEDRLDEKNVVKVEPSKLENMIAKANYLYSSGSKDEALFLYEKIAIYSEAISLYNLGVAQLINKQYTLALNTFSKAINNDEKRCVSAINAAVCSLHLEDQESFKYYINLAHAYLPYELESPLYSYYYALINYYNGNYLGALSALQNPTSDEYPEVQKHLKAKIDALFGNNFDAIESMEKNLAYMDDFSIALLYARVADYTLAIDHFEEAILKNIEPVKSQLALGLVNIKAGRIVAGSTKIKNITDMFPEEVYKYYPIKVKLKEAIFNPAKAQAHYRNNVQESKLITYQKIFYFSPYKVFNANIYIDNIQSAQEYLKKSASSSNVNLGIAKAIKKALEFKIRDANTDLKKLVLIQPKHSILHYNLALTYAQMGDMPNANKHFTRSYHLDAKNYLSGIFTIMTAELINKENTKLKSIIKDAIMREDINEEIDLYRTLLYIADNNAISAIEWLDNDYKQRPLYLALDVLIAQKLNRMKNAQKSSRTLTNLLPHDILPHVMYIDTHFYDLEDIQYSRKVLNYLKKQSFNFEDLYFGPYITRYLYIQQKLITGNLYFVREQLREVLDSTNEDTQEIVSALALASLYDGAFEESYTLYNTLIDELKIRDSYTLFLGAVASTAANHHANAIALLELSKMKNKNFSESRYALGLLYLEVQNNQGATIQLSKIQDDSFSSEYFDFDIDLDKLLFQKQHQK